MKINENSSLTTSKPQSAQLYETPKLEGGSSAAVTSRPNIGDNIDLGSQASLLSQAQSAGAAESSAAVQRLRSLIQAGQYQVDPAALSQSIVSSAVNDY
ncbi:MAG TPA: flagellar biosynthesis anti-sigma factor FlgM [Bryobacteraceae bacterium]|jgi:anti-sigma28 factor (negative regulator of flagellin synthesis)